MFRNLADNPLLLILLVLIVVLVFGANKLPGAARSLGRSMRIFKSEVREMRDDDRPARPSADPEEPPLQGRVVDPPRRPRPDERTDGQRSPSADADKRDS